MKVTALLVVLALSQTAEASLEDVLNSLKGKSTVAAGDVCKALGKTYQGYGSSGGALTVYTITCSGSPVKVSCKGSPFNCCYSDSAPGSKTVCDNVKPGPTCSWNGWTCPSSWSTSAGAAPADAKDAHAFMAANNVFRCMHDVIPVKWDAGVHADAKKWAEKTGEAMVHSHSPSGYRKGSDGENLAGTFKFSKKPGVDATHMWYAEIEENCHWSKKCTKTFTPGHFTAMMWSSIDRIAYSDTTGKLAVGRYRGCDNKPPNFNDQFKDMIHVPVHNYKFCLDKVLACPAFKGLKEDDLDGCDSSAASDNSGAWSMVYKQKCAAKYDGILAKMVTLYDGAMPDLFQPLLASAGVLGLGVALLVVGSLAVVVRNRRRLARGHPLVDTDGAEMEESLE